MDNKVFNEFISLSDQIKELTQKKKILGDQIMGEMDEKNMEKVETDSGVVTMAVRTSYKFTENVSKAAEALKELQEKEVNEGKAEKVETKYLRTSLRTK